MGLLVPNDRENYQMQPTTFVLLISCFQGGNAELHNMDKGHSGGGKKSQSIEHSKIGVLNVRVSFMTKIMEVIVWLGR